MDLEYKLLTSLSPYLSVVFGGQEDTSFPITQRNVGTRLPAILS